MKKCCTCKMFKINEDFSKKTISKDGYAAKCKQCQIEYQKIHYQNNKGRIYHNNLERRKNLANEVNKLKNIPCKDCDKIYEPYCMDFDHLRDKTMAISKMIHETFSFEEIKKEIEKCELVCVLCHRLRTYNRGKNNVVTKRNSFPCYNRNISIIREAKNKPCEICGIQYHFSQMEFDHINEDSKINNVGSLLSNKEDKIIKEIFKCQLLCSLCHRRKTKMTLWS